MAFEHDPRAYTAVHEAGHVVAHVALRVPFRYVTLRPRTPGAAGLVHVAHGPYSSQGDDCDVITYLAGALAEARHRWSTSSGEASLEELELEYYKAETTSSDYLSIPVPIDGSIEAHWAATHDLIERRWPEVQKVAEALLGRFTLSAQEVRDLCPDCDDRAVLRDFGLLDRAATRREERLRIRALRQVMAQRGLRGRGGPARANPS